MLAIIYPYRNRDSKRLKKSFDSLSKQTNKNFVVHFIDYGSLLDMAREIKELCLAYPFISYRYYPTQFQPWNKSRALNAIIKKLDTEYCFVTDADIIFHPDFVDTALSLTKNKSTTYFQVGYLDSLESQKEIQFESYKEYRLSNNEATGLSLFPVSQLKDLNGFDEFYHFWGAEDTDIHVRLRNAGYKVEFYKDKLLLLHQWHESYQRREKSELTQDLQVNGILPLNHQHLKNAIENGVTRVNDSHWGEILNKEEFEQMEKAAIHMMVSNEKRQVNDILYGQLPHSKNKIFKVRFNLDPFEKTWKYKTKKLLGKKVPEYYTLKEINDLVLIHLISFYRNNPYSVKVDSDSLEIEIAIKFS